MPTQISQNTQQRVIEAVEKMSSLYLSGLNPEAALTKVAVDYGFTPDLLRIVGRGFNSGQTLTEMSNGSTLAEKTAGNNPLVDIESVIRQVFSQSKAAHIQDTVSPTYRLDFHAPATVNKAASVAASKPVVSSPVAERPAPWLSPDSYSRAEKSATILDLRRDIKQLDREYAEADMAFVTKFAAVTDALLDIANTKKHQLPELRDITARQLGKEAVAFFDAAVRRLDAMPRGGNLLKLAMSSVGIVRELPVNASHPVLNKLSACCGACKSRDAARARQIKGRAMAAKMHRMTLGQDRPAPTLDADNASQDKKAQAYLDKFAFSAGMLAYGLMNAATKNREGVDPASAKFREAELQMADPEHDQNLQNIRIRATLQDLIDYDPVVQSYDPEEVLSAFNELSQSNPSTLDNPVALRASLRRLLQGDVAMHEVSQLTKDETERKKFLSPLTAQV
jgi:hypothetical protein